MPVAAQTVTDPAEVPVCKTTAGDAGLLFHGTFGMVYASVAYDHATTAADNPSFAVEVRDGLGVFALGGKDPTDSPQQVDAAPVALVKFTGNGTTTYPCAARGKQAGASRQGLSFDPGDFVLHCRNGWPC